MYAVRIFYRYHCRLCFAEYSSQIRTNSHFHGDEIDAYVQGRICLRSILQTISDYHDDIAKNVA